ncbi:hypothetical protein AB7M17_003602 [Bradyrhizobium sp. USDA 377]
MKLTKTLFLGSAAGLMAVSGAFAADLPVKAKAVEYVKVCSLYGAGFYYIPGTDTCIKLGGYLRADAVLGSNSDFNPNQSGTAGARNRLMNYYTFRAREDLNIDTRTATEYGVVRTFFDGVFTWTTGNYTPHRFGDGCYPVQRYARSQRCGHRPRRLGQRQRQRHRRQHLGWCARRVLRFHPVRRLHDG